MVVLKKLMNKNRAENLIKIFVPELRDLGKGCIVDLRDVSDCTRRVEVFGSEGDLFVGVSRLDGITKFNKNHITNIVGQEINIGHVMTACTRKYNTSSFFDFDVCVANPDKIVFSRIVINSFGCRDDVKSIYNPLKPFQNQSANFYEFIVKILE